MKKLTTLLLGLCAAISTMSAQAQTSTDSDAKLYARPEVVIAFPGHFDTAVGGGLAVGYTVFKAQSVEAEAIAFSSKDGGYKVKFLPVLGSYVYSLKCNPDLHVRFGASIGATFEKADYFSYSHSTSAFTFGGRFGLSYGLAKNISLDLDASLLHLEETSITSKGNIVLTTAGVNFRF